MELVNVRDLFRRQDEYVDQTIAIGGWVKTSVTPKTLDLSW